MTQIESLIGPFSPIFILLFLEHPNLKWSFTAISISSPNPR